MGVLVYAPNVNAKSIAAQIKSGKLSFEEAAAKYSIAPNKDKGGDMGPVEWDRLNPEWEGRLIKMKPGDVTDIFDLQGRKAQVHLFRPGGDNAEKQLTLEQATPQIDASCVSPRPWSALRTTPASCGTKPLSTSGCKRRAPRGGPCTRLT